MDYLPADSDKVPVGAVVGADAQKNMCYRYSMETVNFYHAKNNGMNMDHLCVLEQNLKSVQVAASEQKSKLKTVKKIWF